MSKKLLLIDGSSFLFRAYHAVPPLSNAEGMPTNAIFGVASMLRRLISNHKTDYFAVIFDAPGGSFRNELYSEYKSHRPPMPDDLRVQIQPLHDLIRAMGLPLIMETGVEADDVIGALTHLAVDAGFQVIISTGDKDMAQLVSDQVTLENTMSNTVMDVQGVIDKFGVSPEQIIDYLALMGDSADNIPGVAKVGPKTAAKWLAQYQTLENLIANAGEIKGKVGENLRASLDELALSKQLTTIKCDLDLPYHIDDLRCIPEDKQLLQEQLELLGFNTWSKSLQNTSFVSHTPLTRTIMEEDTGSKPSIKYEMIVTMKAFNDWLDKLKSAELFAFDTETTSLDYTEAEIVGVSFAVTVGEAAYVPLAHDYPGVPEQLSRDEILQILKPLLESPTHKKVGQNLKYDANVLANYAIELCGIAQDTMLESYVVDSTRTKHNMDDLAKVYLNRSTIHYEDVAGKGAKQIGFAEVPIEQATQYAAEDADITLALHQVLAPKLAKHKKLVSLYENIEIPMLSVLSRMERTGVLIDSNMLAQQSMELANHIMAIEQQAHEIAGQSFNIASPKQIQEILYDKLNLPVLKKTPKGQPSTAESVLQELAEEYPLPELILKHRSMSKLKSTYTDKLPLQVSPKTGRVHTSYHQAIAATGRLSSSNPNLQNIPVRSPEGRKIRQAFIAPMGYKIVAADYSQIELRIMAHLSGDEGLLDAFAKGEDIHKATAADVFDINLEQVTTDLRRSAKAINFGLIYGMSSFGLAKQLGVGRKQAQEYIDLYFARYPRVKQYMDDTRELAKQQGYVETLLGRRLYLPEIHSKNAARRQYAERTAINAPMQGTAADIIKLAMIATDKWIQDDQPDIKMIMQVHDELVFEIAEAKVDEYSSNIRQLMSEATNLDVPLVVDIGVGINWDEAH
ncbi:DNA polymerase I [methanotrophic endosymbiont of Bathymodiolus puteoserpentis (Logatchev)]|jgi:DNA polymerase-1|uniref:DNA polymerase I n=1 Tax=methanotrophic endosymbiont of Bathymodiolus puteoserpentis (Logatchev) TaxID=343235 RepID=UPI0013C9080F|nr:DNA polymerase I [methanotrophic endosymbiont of Bathymodiolus puteoserpentis (Logatchev)]SHE20351.1 DNA polymerase I [methanotrophic endosymbiont of Bathymodiolus puteoserpentis (Logatchev)]